MGGASLAKVRIFSSQAEIMGGISLARVCPPLLLSCVFANTAVKLMNKSNRERARIRFLLFIIDLLWLGDMGF